MFLPDFKDMLSAFSEEGVEYLLVGAFAVAIHAVPRATGDIDLWVRPDPVNARRVWRALASFGAPLSKLSEEDLARPGEVLQIGVYPIRIDILTEIAGVDFEDAWRERAETEVDGISVPVISRRHLLANKRACGRPKDLADIALIEERSRG